MLDNLRTGSPDNLAGVQAEFIRGDVRDAACVSSAMAGVDYVFHLAGMVSVPESIDNPRECFELNTLGTVNVLEAAAAAGVFASPAMTGRGVLTGSAAAVFSGGIMIVSTRLLSKLALLALLRSSIASFPAAIIHAETPMTAAHRKRTM